LTITKKLLNRTGPRRIRVDQRVAHALREQYRADNAYVSRRYFDSSQDVFRYVPVPEATPATTTPEVLAMLDRLDEFVPGADDLLIETALAMNS
jgi:hypothetical protein